VHVPARAGEPARFAVSPVRAKIHLSWAPFTPLAGGVASLVEARAVPDPVPETPAPETPEAAEA
jgi:hypothetical protein